jgi:NodT family efflux transporter outer membrane factor (OMF) lipoprotein
LVLLVTLVGCARVKAPDKDLATRLEYDKAARERYKLDPLWWKSFCDPRLDSLVELAQANNKDLAVAAISLSRAMIQTGLAQADLFPTLSGSMSATVSKNLKSGSPSTKSYSSRLGLSYEFDLWRKLAGTVTLADFEYLATAEDMEATRQTLINKVVDAYYNLAYLNDALVESERNLNTVRLVERTVLLKHQNGQAAAVEPIEAAKSVLNAKDAILNGQQQIKSAEQTIRNLLNLGPGDPLNLEGLSLKGVRPPDLDLTVPLTVLANRPDLRAAELRLFKAYKNVKLSELAWLPSISLSSAISASSNEISNLLDNPSGNVGLTLNLPFLDPYRVTKNIHLSELDYESARLSFESAILVALNEVDLYYHDYVALRDLLESTRKKYSYSLKITEYYRERYQAGASELSDWLNAVNSSNSAALAVLNGVYQLIISETRTFQAMGGRFMGDTQPVIDTPAAGPVPPNS